MGVTSSRRITSQDRAILDMKVQRDKVKLYQRKIEAVLDKERELAKACLQKGDKDRALLSLRRRKYQQQLLAKTDQQLATLEQLTCSIEFALVEKDVMYGLKQGNAVLKELHREMSLEAVEKLIEDTAEAIAYQKLIKEITEMLGTKITNEDEEQVIEELQEIQRQLALEELPEMPSAPSRIERDQVVNPDAELQLNDPIIG